MDQQKNLLYSVFKQIKWYTELQSRRRLLLLQSRVWVMLIHTSTGRTQLSNGEVNGSGRIMAIDQSLQRAKDYTLLFPALWRYRFLPLRQLPVRVNRSPSTDSLTLHSQDLCANKDSEFLIELPYPSSWVQLWHTEEDSDQHLTYLRRRRRARISLWHMRRAPAAGRPATPIRSDPLKAFDDFLSGITEVLAFRVVHDMNSWTTFKSSRVVRVCDRGLCHLSNWKQLRSWLRQGKGVGSPEPNATSSACRRWSLAYVPHQDRADVEQ